MKSLTNNQIIECYFLAIQLNMDDDFIQILLNEMKKRKLEVKNKYK